MEDRIISLNTAKLVKEKRCNLSSFWWYDLGNGNKLSCDPKNGYGYQQESKGLMLYAPTQSLLQKWLREMHMIRMFVQQGSQGNFIFNIYTWDTPNNGGKWSRYNNIQSYNSYEETMEVGLREALKLLE